MKKFLINTSLRTPDGVRGDLIYVEANNIDEAIETIKENGHMYDSYQHMEITNPIQVISRKLY